MTSQITWISRLRILSILGLVTLTSVACAKPAAEELIPGHPFSRWVSELEPGKTEIEAIRERFGPPDEISQSVRGDTIWRYAYREIDWPAGDSMRPVVSSNAPKPSAGAEFLAGVGRGFLSARRWIDGYIYFPPRQDRGPRSRRLPATIHSLQVEIGPDDTLTRFHYAPKAGVVSIFDDR